jgi:hypothetical protein
MQAPQMSLDQIWLDLVVVVNEEDVLLPGMRQTEVPRCALARLVELEDR